MSRLYRICAPKAHAVRKREVSESWTRRLQHGKIDYRETVHSETYSCVVCQAGKVMLHI